MASRSVSPDHLRPPNLVVRKSSWMVTKLPRLFDIFSPSTCRKPLCIQTFAMGKDEIDPAAVDIEDVAARVVAGKTAAERFEQRRHRHRRALDVPAWAP